MKVLVQDTTVTVVALTRLNQNVTFRLINVGGISQGPREKYLRGPPGNLPASLWASPPLLTIIEFIESLSYINTKEVSQRFRNQRVQNKNPNSDNTAQQTW